MHSGLRSAAMNGPTTPPRGPLEISAAATRWASVHCSAGIAGILSDGITHRVYPPYPPYPPHPPYPPFMSTVRVVWSVNSSDSRGRLVTNGPTTQPRPKGMSRVSDTDSHSRYTPPSRSSKRQYELRRHR